MRLVPRQQPGKIVAALEAYLRRLCPPGVTLKLAGAVQLGQARAAGHRQSRPCTPPEPPWRRPSGANQRSIRCGASVPVAELFQRLLKLDAVLMGFGLPSDNLHGPNEHLHLDQLWRGSIAAAAFMHHLAERR